MYKRKGKLIMNGKLQLLLLLLIIFTLFILIRRIRAKKLLLQYSLSWLSLLIVLLVVCCFPQVLDSVSEIVGIAVPINMVFFLGFCFLLLIVFELTQVISKMSEQIKYLAQKIALLEKEGKDK